MNPMDILGELLKRRSGGSGKGPDILKDILRPGGRSPAGRPTASRADAEESTDFHQTAKELEDLLNVAGGSGSSTPTPTRSRPPVDVSPAGPPTSSGRSQRSGSPDDDRVKSLDDKAMVLARAMVNAAKADGQFTSSEQQTILQQFGDTSADMLTFLRQELGKPLDVREFAWSVPPGMEQQVYAMSLMAIDVDTPAESEYLRQLAHGLRISQVVVEQLNRRYGGGI